jgi:hypothetical protein
VAHPSVSSKLNCAEERVNVEFSHEELFDLLVQLDRVQAQLDGMNN